LDRPQAINLRSFFIVGRLINGNFPAFGANLTREPRSAGLRENLSWDLASVKMQGSDRIRYTVEQENPWKKAFYETHHG
jgi:hypothetical protein